MPLPLDDSRWWDALYGDLLTPLKQAFWAGCEEQLKLSTFFAEQLERSERRSNEKATPILHVSGLFADANDSGPKASAWGNAAAATMISRASESETWTPAADTPNTVTGDADSLLIADALLC